MRRLLIAVTFAATLFAQSTKVAEVPPDLRAQLQQFYAAKLKADADWDRMLAYAAQQSTRALTGQSEKTLSADLVEFSEDFRFVVLHQTTSGDLIGGGTRLGRWRNAYFSGSNASICCIESTTLGGISDLTFSGKAIAVHQ